jgi:hypothetical protein
VIMRSAANACHGLSLSLKDFTISVIACHLVILHLAIKK